MLHFNKLQLQAIAVLLDGRILLTLFRTAHQIPTSEAEIFWSHLFDVVK
jgi:hypothetical protein